MNLFEQCESCFIIYIRRIQLGRVPVKKLAKIAATNVIQIEFRKTWFHITCISMNSIKKNCSNKKLTLHFKTFEHLDQSNTVVLIIPYAFEPTYLQLCRTIIIEVGLIWLLPIFQLESRWKQIIWTNKLILPIFVSEIWNLIRLMAEIIINTVVFCLWSWIKYFAKQGGLFYETAPIDALV